MNTRARLSSTYHLPENFDALSRAQVEQELMAEVAKTPGTLLASFAQVSHVDSTALGILILLQRKAQEQQVALELTNIPPGPVADVLMMVGFDRLFTLRHLEQA